MVSAGAFHAGARQGEKGVSAFREDDARLAGMHGYAAVQPPGTRVYLGKRLITGPEAGWTDRQKLNWVMTGDPDRGLDA